MQKKNVKLIIGKTMITFSSNDFSTPRSPTCEFDMNRWPRRCFSRVRNSQKSHGAISGKYGRWGDSSTLVFTRYSCTSRAVWRRALSWCKIHQFFSLCVSDEHAVEESSRLCGNIPSWQPLLAAQSANKEGPCCHRIQLARPYPPTSAKSFSPLVYFSSSNAHLPT